MTNPKTIRTPRRRMRFLEVLGDCAIVIRAAKAAGASRTAFYDWRREDAEFARDWDAAVELGIAALEDEALRRVLDGVEEPVFYQGKQVAMVRKFSDPLLMFMLRARRPNRYRERPAGPPTPPDFAPPPEPQLTPEIRNARIIELLRKSGALPPEDGTGTAPGATPDRQPLPGLGGAPP